MSVILVFLLVILGVAGWWLSQQRLMSKPWLEHGPGSAAEGLDRTSLPTDKIALVVFLAVIGALFALFASVYYMRAELADWRTMPMPSLLWLNTAVLVLSSVALQSALAAARDGDENTTRFGLLVGDAAAVAFLIGQALAWRQLVATGYVVAGNPADSFFYLLTGLHGLHIVGGLVALGRTTAGAWGDAGLARTRARLELCAMYAHFLLLVWFGLLVLFAGWVNDFIYVCSQVLT